MFTISLHVSEVGLCIPGIGIKNTQYNVKFLDTSDQYYYTMVEQNNCRTVLVQNICILIVTLFSTTWLWMLVIAS